MVKPWEDKNNRSKIILLSRSLLDQVTAPLFRSIITQFQLPRQ